MRIRLRRRRFGQLAIASTVAAAIGGFAKKNLAQNSPKFSTLAVDAPDSSAINVMLRVNGTQHALKIEPCVSLLDALREYVGLTGTKKGCNQGACGACTVLVEGQRINSCLTLAVMQQNKEIITIEGLARGNELHPVQTAFIRHDGFQCGYCTSGQICSAVGMLQEAASGTASAVTEDVRRTQESVELTDTEIKERMSGNICRCGAYPGIVAAIREVSNSIG